MDTPSAGRQPPSFKTNVNRAKTKRWVEAKSYSYDGDDWGEVDDYDEFGGYDEPPPPTRPTGLRQQGQSATQGPPGAYTNRPDIYQSPVDNKQQGYRNLSGPASAQPQYGDPRELSRSDSFNRGDERRAFSAGAGQQRLAAQDIGPCSQTQAPQTQSHATRFSQIEGINQSHPIQSSPEIYPPGQHYPTMPTQIQPGLPRQPLQVQSRFSMDDQSRSSDQTYSAGGNYRGVSYSDQPRQTSMGSRTQSMTSNVSSQDFHNRRDFTPSAVPPPLQTRGSPSPQSASHSQPSVWHPPRKDSLSQHGPSNAPHMNQPIQVPAQPDLDDDAPARQRAGSNTSKPLPFVRPADIYRRMQDEKEKERQSQESSRPSMDVIMGGEATPVFAAHGDRSSMDSLGRGPLRRSSFETLNDGDTTQRLKPTLDPVKERKSEYGLEGFSVNDLANDPQELPVTSTSERKATPVSQTDNQDTLKPMLPDVTRMSGFGESFLDTISSGNSQPAETEDSTTQLSPQTPKPEESNTGLQHQSSVGFRSIVNQAFDTPEDQVPPTPSSTADSTVGRSASGGTSVVSPINISRMPSAAATTRDAGESSARPATPTIPHIQSSNDISKRLSSDPLGTPRPIASKATPSQSNRPGATESKVAQFIPGHRRDLSTPSPDNSPARTPALESSKNIQQPQQVELAMTTPIERTCPVNPTLESAEAAFGRQPNLATSTTPREVGPEAARQQSSVTNPPVLPPDASRRSRPESPSSNKVRDLAEKFESRSNSPHDSERSMNQRGNLPTVAVQNDVAAEFRPSGDRMESFRPRLPGGWDSFASSAPSFIPRRQETFPRNETREEGVVSYLPNDSKSDISVPAAAQNILGRDEDVNSKAGDPSIPKSNESDALSDPFSAVTAAGTALAGALAAAIGMEHEYSEGSEMKNSPTRDQSRVYPKDLDTRNQHHTVVANSEVLPDALKSLPPIVDNHQMSSVVPTPLSNEGPQILNEKVETPDYFPPIVPLKPRLGSYINTDEAAAAHQRPPMPPSLSTDTASMFESDRLRREIVRDLDPTQSSEPTTAESDSPWQDNSRMSANPSLVRQGHDSGVLPSEYDNYWNGSSSASSSRTNSAHDHIGAAVAVQRHDGAALVGIMSPLNVGSDRRVQSPRDTSESKGSTERPALQHRFSWEQSTDNSAALVKTPREVVTSYARTDLSPPLGHHNMGSPTEPPSGRVNNDDTFNNSKEPVQGLELADSGTFSPFTEAPRSGTPGMVDKAPRSATESHTGEFTGTTHSPTHPAGLQVVESGLGQQQVNLSVSHYPNQIEQAEPSIPHQGHAQMPESPSQSAPTRAVRHGNLPPLPPPSDQPKLRAFREILALKEPNDRIQAFNETREQFAQLNTGLAHWLDMKIRELPEHAHLLSNQGRFTTGATGHKPSPSRSKILGIRTAGSPSTQQPYYQQYLNASYQPTASDDSSVLGYQGSTLPQGFSASGSGPGKLSSQQVQAKGKDLLHTAGVFGGKANVAAKGLFSKGRSRFKGSGGADKASTFTLSPNPISQGMQPQYQPQPISNPSTSSCQPATEFGRQPTPDSSRSPSTPQRPLSFSQLPGSTHSTLYDARALPQIPSSLSPKVDVLSQHHYDDRGNRPAEEKDEPGPTNHDHLSRSPSPSAHLDSEREFPQPPQSSLLSGLTTADDSIIRRSREINIGESNIGSSSVSRSPQWADNSNKTPTQADFTSLNQDSSLGHGSVSSVRPRSAVSAADLAVDPENGQGQNIMPSPSRYYLQNQGTVATPVNITTERHAPNHSRALNKSEESDVTFYSAASHTYPSTTPPSHQYSQVSQPDTSHPFEEPRHLNYPSDLGASLPLPTSVVSPNTTGISNQRAPRPFSFMDKQNQSERQSRHSSQRSPSIHSVPSRLLRDRPPSPVSPQPSVLQETPAQRGRAGPIHHGTDHDFLPDSSQTSTPKRRSRSFSRLFKTSDHDSLAGDEQTASKRRSRSISRLFNGNPDLNDHPAYRQESLPAGGTDMPMHYYPEQISREDAIIPRQQATEYQLEGVGPPPAQPVDARSRSRNNSKGSASFFKPPSSSARESSVTQSGPEGYTVASLINSPAASQKKSKRTSLFRSLTGQKGHDRDQGRTNSFVPTSESHGDPQQSGSIIQKDNNSSNQSGGESNRVHNKLQRTSTSGFQQQEHDGGKKKRFSAMGSLFGRSNISRRQSTVQIAQPRVPSQQASPSAQSQPYASDTGQPATTSQPREYYQPRQAYVDPLLGGYYAPGRIDPRDVQDFVARESPSAHRSTQVPPPVQPTSQPGRAPEPPAYVQDATLRQRVTSPSQGTPPPKSRTPSWIPQRPSNTSGSSTPRTSIFIRSKSRDKSSGRRSTDHPPSNDSTLVQPLPQSENPNIYYLPPLPQQTLPTHPSNPYPPKLETPPRNADSPPPPPPPPKDEWHQSHPRHASLHSRSPSGISALTSHTRSPSGFSQQQQSSQQASHSRNPSAQFLSQPQSPEPRRLSAEIRRGLPPLMTNVGQGSHQAANVNTGSAKNTSAESRKKRQQELEMGVPGPGVAIGEGRKMGQGDTAGEGEERIAMSPTSYPGQEWTPGGFGGGWEHY